LAAAATALELEAIATEHGGVATSGAISLQPGIPTAVPGAAELQVDLRHGEARQLAEMLAAARAAAARMAAARECTVTEEAIWGIEPIPFDERLVAAAREQADGGYALASGALHDAAEMARHLPTTMLFSSSTAGLSHAKEEDTPEEHLELAIAAFGRLAGRVIAGEVLR
jgi:acetylornithine deacetylase/succinyl-diaminopimelate desuccinylase-like protein